MEIFGDFNTTVEKALDEIDPKWRTYNCLIICGTHSPKNWEEQIAKVRNARDKGIPFLGICWGHQIACIEWARNKMKIDNATSEELGVPGAIVVRKRRDGLRVGLHNGESYWHNYEVAEGVEEDFNRGRPDNFITCQFHPEYQSSIERPHPLLVTFLQYARKTVAM